MNNLLKFVYASSLKQLPKSVQDCFENEEEFVDMWMCKTDPEKTELLGMYLCEAVYMSIKTDKDLNRFVALSIVGLQDSFDKFSEEDEEEQEEIQEVVIPTIQQPTQPSQDTTELQNRIRELEEENKKLKAQAPPKEKVEGRGKGRPPKHTSTGFRCDLCAVCLASHGSLHNHYESKPHNAKVMNVLNESKKHVEKGLNTKIIVKVRSHLDDPEFTKENPDKEHLDNIKDYVKDGHNPITDILLVHRESKEVSWNKMC